MARRNATPSDADPETGTGTGSEIGTENLQNGGGTVYVVRHTMVGGYFRGQFVTADHFGPDADIQRLINLGAISEKTDQDVEIVYPGGDYVPILPPSRQAEQAPALTVEGHQMVPSEVTEPETPLPAHMALNQGVQEEDQNPESADAEAGWGTTETTS